MTSPVKPWTGRVRVVGPGRAGGAFTRVLAAQGWDVLEPIGHGDDPNGAARGTDLVIIATPDSAVATVAESIAPTVGALVVHLAGSLGTEVLATHPRRGALHPLVSIPDPAKGAARLRKGAWFAVAASDPEDLARLESLIAALDGHALTVADSDRAAYHAAAVIASNHLVALIGQVERVAAGVGLPLEPFLALASATLDGLGELGPAAALTGPVARGDWDTVARHLRVLTPAERPAYVALAAAAARLIPEIDELPTWLSPGAGDDTVPGSTGGVTP